MVLTIQTKSEIHQIRFEENLNLIFIKKKKNYRIKKIYKINKQIFQKSFQYFSIFKYFIIGELFSFTLVNFQCKYELMSFASESVHFLFLLIKLKHINKFGSLFDISGFKVEF